MKRPPLALPIACVALFVALGGPSYAAKLVTGADIKDGSVTGKDVKNSSLRSADVKNGSLVAADLKADTLRPKGFTKRVVATNGATDTAARELAPQVTLFKAGALTVYGKCYTENDGSPSTYGAVFVKTATNGALLQGEFTDYYGGSGSQFLNTSTPETNRYLYYVSASANQGYAYGGDDYAEFSARTATTAIHGFVDTAVKNGTLLGSNGAFGAGNVCLFSGTVFAN